MTRSIPGQWSTGSIVSVTQSQIGDALTVAAATGDTLLTLGDTAEFDSIAGGQLQLNDTVYDYIAIDEDAETVTLASGLVADADEGDRVLVIDAGTGAVAIEARALVALPGRQANDDSIDADVAQALVPLLADGLRDAGAGESVTMTERDGTWTVVDVHGRKPIFDSDSAHYNIITGAQTDPDAVSITATAAGVVDYGGSTANGSQSVAIGFRTDAEDGSVAVGPDAKGTAGSTTAVGHRASATGGQALALGSDTQAKSAVSVVVGGGATVGTSSNFGIAIGCAAEVFDDNPESIAIGDAAFVSDNSPYSIGIGFSSGVQTDSDNGVAIGPNGTTVRYSSPGGVALGKSALVEYSDGGIAIGALSHVDGDFEHASDDSIAIGPLAIVGPDSPNALALGGSTQATGAGSVAIGQGAESTDSGNVAIGTHARAVAQNSVAIGSYALNAADSGAHSNTAIGENSLVSVTDGKFNTAVGAFSLGDVTTGSHNTVVGEESALDLVDGNYNTFLGNDTANGHTLLHGSYNTFVGCSTSTSADLSGTVTVGVDSAGNGATATADDEFVLGTGNHLVQVPGRLNVAPRTPSGTADTQGAVGDITSDDNYLYAKTTGGWKRAALSTF